MHCCLLVLNIDITTKMGVPIQVRIVPPFAMNFNDFSPCTEPVRLRPNSLYLFKV